MSLLRENVREHAFGLCTSGVAEIHATCHFNGHVSTITQLHDRFNCFGSVNELPKSDQPRVTARIQDTNRIVTHLCYRYLSAKYTARRTIGTYG